MDTPRTYERKTLYSEVWAEPVSTVAKKYGVSDVAIRKACKRLNVPLPPRGYWTKVQAGRAIKKRPLPPTDGLQVIFRPNPPATPRSHLPNPPHDRLLCLPGEERGRILEVCDTAVVKDKLLSPHPLIRQDQEARQVAKEEQRERDRALSLNRWAVSVPTTHPEERMLAIYVQPEEFPRAYRLLDAIFKAVESLGGTATISKERHMQLVVQGEPVPLRMRSKEDAFTL